MTDLLLGTAAAAACALTGHAAAAQATTSYTFTGIVDGDAANPFTGSFSLLNTAGVYSLGALSASYHGGTFSLANSGLTPVSSVSLFIGGTTNDVGGIAAGTDDFRFNFNPVTGTAANTGNFVTSAQTTALSSVTLAFAAAPTVASATPEPAAWGMMILGFGLAGAALRRRRVTTRVAFTG